MVPDFLVANVSSSDTPCPTLAGKAVGILVAVIGNVRPPFEPGRTQRAAARQSAWSGVFPFPWCATGLPFKVGKTIHPP